MVDYEERIYKCPKCSHFREKTAEDFGFQCPVHGSHLRLVGNLRDLYRPDLLEQ